MPVITLKTIDCPHCHKPIRATTIDIESFKKNMFNITETTLKIWNDRTHCWICKEKPKVGETWGLSLNNNERNRLFCPKCSEVIENKLKGQHE